MIREGYNRKFNKNLIFSFIEHLTSIVTLFLVYRYIINFMGIEMLGLWSFVLALMSLTSIGNSGFASSATKFVAKYSALKKKDELKKTIETSLIVIVLITILFLGIIVIIVYNKSTIFFSDTEKANLFIFFPWVLGSFFIGALSRLYLSVLDGLFLIYIRSYIGIFSKVAYLICCLFLIPNYGIEGLAISYFIQTGILLIMSMYSVFKEIPSLSFMKPNFDKKMFKKIFSYGFNFQISSICQMLIDPLVKFLLKEFGSLAQVGYFEIVYKFYFQVRQLIVVLVNIFVPIVASLNELAKNEIKKMYGKVFKLTYIVSIMALSFLFAWIPALLSFVKVSFNIEMLNYSTFIYLGLIFNLLSVSAYVFNLGLGSIKNNTISSIYLALGNCIFSALLGYYFSTIGVIIGWSIGQLIGTIMLLRLFRKSEKIKSLNYIEKQDLILIFSFLLAISIIYIVGVNFDNSILMQVLINNGLLLLCIAVPLFNNKTIRKIISESREKLLSK